MSESWRDKDFLTPRDIADVLGVHLNTGYNIAHKLPHFKVGKLYRVKREAFEQWMKDQERNTANE